MRASSHCRFCEVRRCWRRSRQQSATEWEELTAPPVGEKAKVPDAREAPREYMFEKAAQKHLVSQRHHPLFAVMRVVFPAEHDVGIGEIEEAVVRDRDPMCVSGQIMQNVLGTAEGALGVHHPVLPKEGAKKCEKRLLIRQREARAMEDEFLSPESVLETGHKFSAEDAAQDPHRQKESRSRTNPVLSVRRRTAAGYDAMHVRVPLQGLAPGVKDTQKPDLSPEMFGIGGNFEERFRARLKQKPEEDFLVLPD
jgi:hypothetical protein